MRPYALIAISLVISACNQMPFMKKTQKAQESQPTPQQSTEVSKDQSPSASISPSAEKCSLKANDHINAGIAYINSNQVLNAIKEFQVAVKESPSCPTAYGNLVSAHVLNNDLRLAEETYKMGVEKAGDDGFLHATGAIAYAKRREYDLALIALAKSLELGYKNIDMLAGPDIEGLRMEKREEFCNLMVKYSVAIKDCIK
ncbi:MAG: hypothetical protein ABDH18_05990 [Aquificaceae bacterium]